MGRLGLCTTEVGVRGWGHLLACVQTGKPWGHTICHGRETRPHQTHREQAQPPKRRAPTLLPGGGVSAHGQAEPPHAHPQDRDQGRATLCSNQI